MASKPEAISYIPAPSWNPASIAFDCWMREYGGTECVSQMLPPITEWCPMVMRPKIEVLE